ncbi:MAG: fused MFS/spermidine synthase [Candidatus Paceibacterota bacterium]
MNAYLLGFIVFISGATVMTLELVGSRVLSPFVGNSTVVWTSLIGIVLASLSVGYVWGGRIADRGIKPINLAHVFIGASVFVFLIAILPPYIASMFVGGGILGLTLILTIFLFTPATLLLGMVTPFALKLKIHNLGEVGRDAGGLYALSTIGSIVGTFLGGLVLVSFWGTNAIIVGCGVALLLLAVTIFLSERKRGVAVLLLVCALGASLFSTWASALAEENGLVADIDTRYSRFWIIDTPYRGEPARLLSNGVDIIQSGILLEKPYELMSAYTRSFDIAELFVPEPQKALLVGAGVFTQPKHFIRRNPGAVIDVVDIDSRLEDISRKYFGYIPDDRIKSIVLDGRVYLNEADKQYDIIYMDAFPSYFSIPAHLASRETVEMIEKNLAQNGVVVANIIGKVEGRGSEFVSSVYATYKEVFPNVHVYQVLDREKSEIQNVVLLAYRDGVEMEVGEEVEEVLAGVLSREFTPEPERGIVLTDNFSPVEKMLLLMQL